MDIPTTQEILLFRLMLCATVLIFGATYAIAFFFGFFLFVSNICSDYFRTPSIWNRKIVFFRIFYSWLSFCLQRNSSYLLLYVFPSSDSIVLKHHSALKLSLLLNMCSRGTLFTSLNSQLFFPYYFLSCTPQYFLSRRASNLVHLYLWALIPLAMEIDVLSYNLNVVGGIFKEGWLCDFLINFLFGWLHNLNSGNFGWMLENSSYCAAIVADDDINDKKRL